MFLQDAARLRNDLYCVEWDVKRYYTIPYHTLQDAKQISYQSLSDG